MATSARRHLLDLEVSASPEFLLFRVAGTLHLALRLRDVTAVQSWIETRSRYHFQVEFTMASGPAIIVEYNLREKWVQVLAAIDQALGMPAADGKEEESKGWTLDGEIKVGDVYIWEPNKPQARETVTVTRVDGLQGPPYYDAKISMIGERPAEQFWNDESRVREACIRVPPVVD